MNPVSPPSRKAPAPPRAAQATAPATGKADLAGQRWLTRLSFANPVFGMGEYSWSFICEGAMADALQQALLERRPIKLEFPQNTVVLDTAHVVLADFQPHG